MNSEPCCQKIRFGAYAAGLLGTFLIVAFLVHLMQSYTQAPSLTAIRGAERMQIMAEFKTANDPLVKEYAWQDEGRGFIRVPLDRAMELVLQEWQDPVAARSNLMARAAKEFAPAPKVPEKKSIFE